MSEERGPFNSVRRAQYNMRDVIQQTLRKVIWVRMVRGVGDDVIDLVTHSVCHVISFYTAELSSIQDEIHDPR